ncbi:monooxygenase [Pandoraea pneumonica]|uniref:Monooxygenase n=1 Tax=Pandoraea pneumonica TaxID=2508299 RepID=A0A5E4VQX1_9BURK|nr:FAD-dependent monooxygenase [Pandoraea pneumonica]VVE14748.1 monooxygenase [Pandoraea pneumonica]
MSTKNHDVVIVGAGLAGLSTAVFLALNGVRPLVIERNATTSILPKARGQNPITMEAMRVAGITEAIYAAKPPGKPGITSMVSESLTGRIIYDHVAHRPDFSKFSPERPGMASQARAEEALLQRASELGVEIRFNCSCEEIRELADEVQMKLKDLVSQTDYAITAKYVVAADGIRGGIAPQVGIGSHGVGHLKAVTAVRFTADLSKWCGDNAMTIHYVKNEGLPDGSGILVSTDYENQWVGNFSADPSRSEETTRELIKILVGVPDLQFEITGEQTFNYSHRIADQLSTKRVFLTGDAAHVMPPTGGQGGNTAMQDGYYLGWKLAYVVRGLAGPSLLQTYNTERAPYAEIVCTWQAANLAERRDMKNLATLIGEPIDHAKMMFGYVCAEGAFVRSSNDKVLPNKDPFDDPADPSGVPGSRIPYVNLVAGGAEINTRRVLGSHFQIYTESEDFASAAGAVAEALGVPQNVTIVESTKPLRTSESVLVRPDGIIAWRGGDAGELKAAYQKILAVN